MTDKKITDLPDAARLDSVTYLEVEQTVAGSQASGRVLANSLPFDTFPMDALGQVIGYTVGNTAEVEANTRAVRMTLRSQDSLDPDAFQVNRYAFGDSTTFNLTTSGLVGNNLFLGVLLRQGCALIRKLSVSLATTAVSGTRNGTASMALFRSDSMSSAGTFNQVLPSNRTIGLNVNQSPPVLFLGDGQGSSLSTGTLMDAQMLGIAEAGVTGVVGTNIREQALFEAKPGELPVVLTNWTGFLIQCTVPAAATSQSLIASMNIRWDELVPIYDP